MEVVQVVLLIVSIFVCGMVAFQLLLTKLDYLHEKIGMESAMKEDDQKLLKIIHRQSAEMQIEDQWKSELQKRQDSIVQQLADVSQSINKLNQETGKQFSILHTQLKGLQSEQTANNRHQEMKKGMHLLASKLDTALRNTNPKVNLRSVSFPSCEKEPSKRSGNYLILPPGYEVPFVGFCEQAAYGGGWLVVQYRFDGSVDFLRNWTEYRNGFGNVEGEFWLGLEHLHRLTSARRHELLIELKDFNGTYTYARYDHFEIASESEQYALKTLGEYSGTAEEAGMEYQKGQKFSTIDRDNDSYHANCAAWYKGAWWYNACHKSNLNGLYKNSNTPDSMHWGSPEPYVSHAYSRMMIREA